MENTINEKYMEIISESDQTHIFNTYLFIYLYLLAQFLKKIWECYWSICLLNTGCISLSASRNWCFQNCTRKCLQQVRLVSHVWNRLNPHFSSNVCASGWMSSQWPTSWSTCLYHLIIRADSRFLEPKRGFSFFWVVAV